MHVFNITESNIKKATNKIMHFDTKCYVLLVPNLSHKKKISGAPENPYKCHECESDVI